MVRKKIGIARAIYGNPGYIVLDEPTSKLDAISEERILDLIDDLKKENTALIIITHNAKIIKKADFLLIIKNGIQKMFNTKMNVYKSIQPVMNQIPQDQTSEESYFMKRYLDSKIHTFGASRQKYYMVDFHQ